MIDRELLKLPAVQTVDPRVAHVHDEPVRGILMVDEHETGQRAAGAAPGRIRHDPHRALGALHCGDHVAGQHAGVGDGGLEFGDHGRAGAVAGFKPAHSVGDEEHRRRRKQRVFVLIALAADVGARAVPQRHPGTGF